MFILNDFSTPEKTEENQRDNEDIFDIDLDDFEIVDEVIDAAPIEKDSSAK